MPFYSIKALFQGDLNPVWNCSSKSWLLWLNVTSHATSWFSSQMKPSYRRHCTALTMSDNDCWGKFIKWQLMFTQSSVMTLNTLRIICTHLNIFTGNCTKVPTFMEPLPSLKLSVRILEGLKEKKMCPQSFIIYNLFGTYRTL